MKTLDTYIQRISKLGIIISLLYYEKNKHVLYVIIELVRSLLDFITGKYIDLVNVILIIYYFSLFVYFLNEKDPLTFTTKNDEEQTLKRFFKKSIH